MSVTNKSHHRGYSFVTANPRYSPCMHSSMRYMVYGREVGDTGVPFLQGWVFFKHQKSLQAVRKYFPDESHIYVNDGPKQASTYCKKGGDYEEYGVLPVKGKRKPKLLGYTAIKCAEHVLCDTPEEKELILSDCQ